MANYQTIDSIPDLTLAEKGKAALLFYENYIGSSTKWDYQISKSGTSGISTSVFKFSAKAGGNYDIWSTSYIDPTLLRIYDHYGNAIAINTEDDDGPDVFIVDGYYSRDVIFNWTAPYSGDFYVHASWNQGVFNRYYSLNIFEDIQNTNSAGDDFNNDLKTAGNITLNQPQTGLINYYGDKDWFKVKLTGGYTYQFDLIGSGGDGTLGASSYNFVGLPYLKIFYSTSGAYSELWDGVKRTEFGPTPTLTDKGYRIIFQPSVTGEYYIEASSYLNSTTGTYSINSTRLNQKPIVNKPTGKVYATIGEVFNFKVPNDTFSDPDLDNLLLTAKLQGDLELPSWLTFNPLSAELYGVAPLSGSDVSVVITASDGTDFTNDILRLTLNNKPIAKDILLDINEDDLEISIPLEATDIDNDWKLFSILEDGTLGKSRIEGNILKYVVNPDAYGQDKVAYIVRDQDPQNLRLKGGFSTHNITINVKPQNDAPRLYGQLPDVAAPIGEDFIFNIQRDNNIYDIDSQSIELSLSQSNGASIPGWLIFNTQTNILSGRPNVADAGSYIFSVKASDGISTTTSKFNLTVAQKTDYPGVNSISVKGGQNNANLDGNITITFSEPIQFGSGKIQLKTQDGRIIDSFMQSNKLVSGDQLELNPVKDLSVFTKYVIELDSGAIKDINGNININPIRYYFRSSTIDELYHFFVVAFAAAPGATYMGQLAEAVNYGLSIAQIVEIFTTKPQFTSVYPSTMSNRDLATQLVNNIVKSSASAATKQSAIDDIDMALSIGWSRGKMLYTVFGNLASKPLTDPTWGNTAKQFQNQLAVARYFTEEMGVVTENLATLRGVIGSVTPDSDVSTVDQIVQIIGTIPPGG